MDGHQGHCGPPSSVSPRTLVTGGVGSVLLDWCGWQSVFYFSGGLTLLWVYYVYRYLLNEKGNYSCVGQSLCLLPLAAVLQTSVALNLFWEARIKMRSPRAGHQQQIKETVPLKSSLVSPQCEWSLLLT